jgi:HK97 family phage portal protein
MSVGSLARQVWDWANGYQAVADASFQPRAPELPPGLPNISSGAGPEVRNLPWMPVTEMLALRQPALWSGINLIAGTVGSLPLHGFRHLERVWPTPDFLSQPSPSWTRSELWRALVVDYLIWGNAIAHLQDFDEWGWPHRMRPLPAQEVEARVVDGEVEAYRYNDLPISPAEILHLRWLTRPGHAFGLGILEVLRRTLELMDRLGSHAHEHFRAAGIPSGVINVHRDEVTQEQIDEIKERWMEAHSGPVETPAVLSQVLDWQQVASNPEQSQLLQSRQYSAVEAEFMLNLPPGMLGGGGVGSGGRMIYQNIESLNRMFHERTLVPILTTAEQRLTSLLPGVQYAKFAVEGLLRGDVLTRHRVYEIELNTGIRTIDEIRALEDLPPLGEPQQPSAQQGGQIIG